MTDKIVALSTCGTAEEAEAIARGLLERKLAACVSIVPQMRSLYRWQDKIEDSTEYLLLIKSTRDLFEKVKAEVERMHTYQTPELIALPIVAGSENYLIWLERELAEGGGPE
jgi:periplasmic divalent cation tolerance protein